jgi:uncharacterized membrane protein YraQ (UPF0718 family)
MSAAAGTGRRPILLLLWIALLAGFFWLGSRYPSLDAKALMGGELALEDPLSFEALLEIQPADPTWRRIAFTTINWLHTNERGMTFGILLGAALFSLIRMLRQRALGSAFGNTLLGVVMGAPLGVCVNCAAPIAKGIHAGGARLETTLAAMVSSPTLNVVVLTMTFSILPVYLALTKLAFTLAFILLVIPLLSRTLFREEVADTIENARCAAVAPGEAAAPGESWLAALRGVAVDYARSLWFIVRTTVPLMLLAGFLGAIVATLAPLTSLADVGSGMLAALLLAITGLFLPVPVAFDVILSAVLLAAGLPVLHVMILLFVLGIFSCYSAFIVATTISRRVALVTSAVLVVMGLFAGMTADAFHRSALRGMIAAVGAGAPGALLARATAPDGLRPRLPSADRRETPEGPAEVRIRAIPHRPRSAAAARLFSRSDGDSLGLSTPMDFSVEDFWAPFYNGRGIASADFDGDGWTDLVVGSETGPQLFRNEAGERFAHILFEQPAISQLDVFVVAPVDLDDDGWLDLYLSTYRDGNYFLLSDGGSLAASPLYRVPSGSAVLSHAVAFGDVDRDGDLDAVLGNWSFGKGRQLPAAHSANFLHRNEGGSFRAEALPGISGETLSVLLSDWSGDGHLDLIVGNDFTPPDLYYLGDGTGRFREILREDGLIPVSTAATMSIDSGDVDNDLSLDVYLTNLAARATERSSPMVGPARLDRYCVGIEDPTRRDHCERNIAIRAHFSFGGRHQPSDMRFCDDLTDATERVHCRGMNLLKTAIRERDASLCDHIPAGHDRGRFLCGLFFSPQVEVANSAYRRAIPQTKARNVLLMRRGDVWTSEAHERGVEDTGWSWSGKIADLDNDEWQDIYVVNGTWLLPTLVPSNVFFRNLGDGGFENATRTSGLWDVLIVSAFTFADLDNDGDLDIATNSVNGPLRIFRNNEVRRRALTVELRDHRGNRFGIGSKIEIHYGAGAQRHQTRELKAGGAFLSYDPPVAHFGLGEHDEVARLEIAWSTGERTTLEGPFPSDTLYRIERR